MCDNCWTLTRKWPRAIPGHVISEVTWADGSVDWHLFTTGMEWDRAIQPAAPTTPSHERLGPLSPEDQQRVTAALLRHRLP